MTGMFVRLRVTMARMMAVFFKEIIQMRRDRLTLSMMFGVPLMQLMLFGYAVNLLPKHLPLAVHAEERGDVTRGIVAAISRSGYFVVIDDDGEDSDFLLQSGKANFILTIPAGFSRALVRGEKAQLLLEADASDPTVAAAAGQVATMVDQALSVYAHDARALLSGSPAAEVVVHHVYNPRQQTRYHIVPGLIGVIITMTAVMFTAITITRERERGTMENLLAMPVRPFEVMIGKITPYIGVGVVQTLLVLIIARLLFQIPFVGNAFLLLVGLLLFVLANLTLGFTFSTIARSQLQAFQLTFFFFLPSLLLSGFMFPFRGMPQWAQYLGEMLPLTHFLRIVRGVILKDAGWAVLAPEFVAIAGFWLLAGLLALKRYKVTLA